MKIPTFIKNTKVSVATLMFSMGIATASIVPFGIALIDPSFNYFAFWPIGVVLFSGIFLGGAIFTYLMENFTY